MPSSDLDAFAALPDPQFRFYATIGAAMSLSALIETRVFDVYRIASGLPEADAARNFYHPRIRQKESQKLAHDAVVAALSDEAADTWAALWTRLKASTGERGQRNLLGHVPVTVRTIEVEGPFDPAFFDTEFFDTGGEVEEFQAEQDRVRILAGTKEPRTSDFEQALAYCRELIALAGDLDAFIEDLLGRRGGGDPTPAPLATQ